MITIANYNKKITPDIVKSLPADLQNTHHDFDELVHFYDADKSIKEVVDLYIELLNKFLEKKDVKPKRTKVALKPAVKNRKKNTQEKKTKAKKIASPEISFTFHEDKDFYFLKRFLNLLNKTKSKHQIGLYVKALQRSIIAKEIRKTSKYAEHIMKIQDKLCAKFNRMKDSEATTLSIEKKWEDELRAIANKEKVYKSVMLIKRYIGLAGKRAADKAKLLLKAIESAFRKQEIGKGDPYYETINEIRKNLKKSTDGSAIKIDQAELSGLRGIVEDYEQEELNGCMCDGPINSVDFAKLKFNTLGFGGKWKSFIGDPTPGFTALVYGKPKSGKSTLCAQFAGYMATLGKVLYVSKEEGKNGILQERLIRVNATHPNLDIDDHIPFDKLQDYDYLILDSVHKLGLNEETLDQLPKRFKNIKGFVYIMHSTKGGDFRGSQTYAHNVDVLINVDEGGIATQTGRFAQGSEMDVFDQHKAA
ncbi:AAA family ATPase [Fulvivirga sp. 29W222]|uniref:AAA family ATPase n=1 Tax=Fulvivirga marina TaxID=2494733 RepID=A0A937FTW5_9BACT|nr:AAA family ATPase [Fulvivirga marina]MBL6445689.1 AAA family ATPase [Fulvivirga marina]